MAPEAQVLTVACVGWPLGSGTPAPSLPHPPPQRSTSVRRTRSCLAFEECYFGGFRRSGPPKQARPRRDSLASYRRRSRRAEGLSVGLPSLPLTSTVLPVSVVPRPLAPRYRLGLGQLRCPTEGRLLLAGRFASGTEPLSKASPSSLGLLPAVQAGSTASAVGSERPSVASPLPVAAFQMSESQSSGSCPHCNTKLQPCKAHSLGC